MFTNRPAMKFCCPFILGIILGWYVQFSLPILSSAAIVFFVASLLSGWTKSLNFVLPAFYFLVLVSFGALKIIVDDKFTRDDGVEHYVAGGKTIVLVGSVADMPRVAPRSIRFIVDAESVLTDRGRQSVSGGVYVSISKKWADTSVISRLQYGRVVRLQGELSLVNGPRNPGDFDMRQYLHLNDVNAKFVADHLDSANLGQVEGNLFMARFVHPVRRSVSRQLEHLVGGKEAQFLKGLIIGERGEIPLEVKTAFINSGVMHIIAVSGLHVAIVAFILLIVFQTIRVPEKHRIVLTCGLLVYYMYLTGAAASIARSVIMAIVFLGAKLFEKKSDLYNTLALSAMILLLIDAKQLFQPGFQLSFVAVFALVYLYPKIILLRKLLPSSWQDNRVITGLVAAISVSLAAGIGTLPFTAFYFGKISIISFVANIVIVPLSNVILALGMLAVALSYLWPWLAGVYGAATSLLTAILLWLVQLFGAVPFAFLNSHFTFWNSLGFYAAVGMILRIGDKRYRTKVLITTLMVVNVYLYISLFPGFSTEKLRVTFIDVGQGDAILIESPDGKVILIDAGPRSPSWDTGARMIVPLLRHRGIEKLETVIVSHPHSDHLGGVPSILREFPVATVIDAGSNGNSLLCTEYLGLIDSLGISHGVKRGGEVIECSPCMRLYVLHPTGPFVPSDTTRAANLNNQSIVIKLQFGETSLLLPGDAERESEERMVSAYGSFLHSHALKAGHHGSITSSTTPFLATVQPSSVVISVGERNKFHHPSPAVLSRYAEGGCSIFRTDSTGAVVFESDGRHWSVVDWH